MINWILSWIIQGMAGPLLGFSLEMMLTPKQNRWKRWMRVGLWTVALTILSLAKFLLEHNVTSVVFNAVFWCSITVVTMRLYIDPLWKRMVAHVCLYAGLSSAEMAYFLHPAFYTGKGLSLDFTQPDMLLGSFLALIVSSVIVSMIVMIWRRFQNKRLPRFIWVYVLLPLCFSIPSMQHVFVVLESSRTMQWVSMISLMASAITTLLLIIFMFKQAEQEGIEQELAQIKLQSALEQQYYQDIESRREEMAKIRHDYNNLLTSILGLLQMGRTAEAEQALGELLKRVEDTRERSDSPAETASFREDTT